VYLWKVIALSSLNWDRGMLTNDYRIVLLIAVSGRRLLIGDWSILLILRRWISRIIWRWTILLILELIIHSLI
jgi:hypothetical protein